MHLQKQIHTTGEDRFAGALAILKMVDPERAEQIRNAANQKRKKEISYESLLKRSDDRKQTRIRKNKETEIKAEKTKGTVL